MALEMKKTVEKRMEIQRCVHQGGVNSLRYFISVQKTVKGHTTHAQSAQTD